VNLHLYLSDGNKWKIIIKIKHNIKTVKVNVHSIICHEGTEREYRCSSTFLNIGATWGCAVNATPRPLTLGNDSVPIA